MTDDHDDDLGDDFEDDFEDDFGDDFEDDLGDDLGDALGDALDGGFGEGFPDDGAVLDDHESALVARDLDDLAAFEATFGAEGYRGVAVYCHDCAVDHYYTWEMLRENLETLLETGDTPVHEPAYEPDPQQYVPWEYARGYVDALRDVGVDERRALDRCARCGFQLPDDLARASFCPRCGSPLLAQRLADVLHERGYDDDEVAALLRAAGLPAT